MTFKDANFWIIFCSFFALLYLIRSRYISYFLTAFSIFFYASLNFSFLVPLFLCLSWDFIMARLIERQVDRKRYLVLCLSVATNIGLLFYYKYLYESLEFVSLVLNVDVSITKPLFPIGVSFYTFQSISYVVDVYRRKIPAETNFFKYTLYVTFFPQLIIGPIERGNHLIPQLKEARVISWSQIETPVYYILWGLVKCVLFSDKIGVMTNFLSTETQMDTLTLFMVSVLTTFKVYADFSGYSDIAIGLAKLFSINLTINFKPFYVARNPAQFWQRWHLSLTIWIRDYLVPMLSPKRSNRYWAQFSLFISFLIIGLWHGPTINWIIFGAFHGIAFMGYRYLKKLSWWQAIPNSCGYLFMMVFYAICGFLHNHRHLDEMKTVIVSANNEGVRFDYNLDIFLVFGLFVFILALFESLIDNRIKAAQSIYGISPVMRALIYTLLLVLIFSMNGSSKTFEYYQF